MTTHHCPRSNWTGQESELRRGICPKCAETTLYEDCSVRPMAITFTDGEGNTWKLIAAGLEWDDSANVTPADLALAGYTPSAENVEVQRLCLEAAKRTRELEALRDLERHIRSKLTDDPRLIRILGLLEAIDEARK